MDLRIADLLVKAGVTLPLGIGAAFFLIQGMKISNRFFYKDYQGQFWERFRDNLFSSFVLCIGIACGIFFVVVWMSEVRSLPEIWGLIPFTLVGVGLMTVVSVLGAYWQSFQTKFLWGGFMPLLQARYGFSYDAANFPQQVALLSKKVPRRIYLSAAGIAAVVFMGTTFALSRVEWQGPLWSGILALLIISILSAFAVFMLILTNYISRRSQAFRDGEPFDEELD